jgi:hypothetical protein
VGLSDGVPFGAAPGSHVRMNFGCPRSTLAEGLSRMKAARGRHDSAAPAAKTLSWSATRTSSSRWTGARREIRGRRALRGGQPDNRSGADPSCRNRRPHPRPCGARRRARDSSTPTITCTRASRGPLLRAQDAGLFEWLEALYPVWGRMTPEMLRVSTQTAMAELILSGCTTSSDHLYLFPNGCRLEDSIQSAAEIGMRFHATRGSMSVGRSRGGPPSRQPGRGRGGDPEGHPAGDRGPSTTRRGSPC